jgi:hypothetical protein
MARSEEVEGERRVRRGRGSDGEWKGERKICGKEKISTEPDISEVRRLRVERLEGSTSTRRSVAKPKMTSESHATLPSLKSTSSQRRKHDPRRSTVSTKRHRKRKSTSKDDSTSTYVYGTPADRSPPERRHAQDGEPIEEDDVESERDHSTPSERDEDKPRRRKVKVIYVKEHSSKSKPKLRRVRSDQEMHSRPTDSQKSVRRSRTQTTRRKSVVEERPISLPRRYVLSIFSFAYTYPIILEALQPETYHQTLDLS